MVSDSNNIFSLHESEDILEKKIISKISVDSNFYVCKLCMVMCKVLLHLDYCVKLSLINETMQKMALIS